MGKNPTPAELGEQVRELEERCELLSANLNSFFVEAPAGIALFDRQGRYLTVNRTLAALAGRGPADHLGRTISEMIPSAVGQAAEAGLRRVLATGEANLNVEINGEMPGQPGVVRHWLHSQFPVYDGKGNVAGAGAIVVETSELKRAFAEISRREQFQKILLESLPQRIYVKDTGLRYVYCNQHFARDLGIRADEIAGRSDYDFFPRELADGYRAADRLVMASGKSEEFDERYSASGEELVVHTVKAPVFSEQGEVLGLLGISQDITVRLAQYRSDLEKLIAERTVDLRKTGEMLLGQLARGRELEEKLSRSEEKYREFVEASEDLITQVDAQGRLLFINQAAQKIFGIRPEECLGRSAFDFVHPEDRAETRKTLLAQTRERRKSFILGNRQMAMDGRVHFLHWTCNCHYDAEGHLLYVNGIGRDVTDLQAVQEALRQACDEQERKIAEQTRELEENVSELTEAIERQRETEAELRESEERFRQIAESVNSVFWSRDLSSGRMLYVSPAYEAIWGRSRESLYLNPCSWLEAVHPDDGERVRAIHDTPRAGEEGIDYRIVRSDGALRWVRSKVFSVCDRNGRKFREISVSEDITAYMDIFERLRGSEIRYRMLFETSTDGISIYALAGKDGKQRLIDCNASYQKMAGRDKSALLDLADVRAAKKFLEKTRGREGRSPSLGLLGSGRCSGLYSWLRQDGGTNFIECRGSLLFLNGSEFMHCVHRDVTEAMLAEERIRHLSRRVVEVVEEEQKRIARDLHDELGQQLLAMRHKADAAQKRIIAGEFPGFPELADIASLIDTIGCAVRNATNRLRPDLLDTLGFVPSLEWGLRDFAARYPAIRTSIEVVGAQGKAAPEIEIALFRVFQEGLTNIGKHAGAGKVAVRLIFSYPSLILTLADDGRGFETDPLSGLALPEAHDGIGLRGMQERMLAIGGTLTVRSRRGEGTMIRAEVRRAGAGKGIA
ncbi:PAS domain-containing protein [Thiovibrio sp. JS02]